MNAAFEGCVDCGEIIGDFAHGEATLQCIVTPDYTSFDLLGEDAFACCFGGGDYEMCGPQEEYPCTFEGWCL